VIPQANAQVGVEVGTLGESATMNALLSQLFQFLTHWISIGPAPPLAPIVVPPSPQEVGTVVFEINAARASNGLAPLMEDPKLDLMARSWAQVMATSVGLSHGDFAGRIEATYPNTAAGEDIAEGQPDAASVVTAWMESPPHRANILGDFNRIGTGSAQDSTGSLYWCADFAQVV
jgi:uncharacterized protein YkwD